MRTMKNRIWIVPALLLALSACVKETVRVTGITLDAVATELYVGETVRLTATVSPSNAENQTIIWSSENASVVKVSDGTVTAVSEGTARVVAKADDDGTITAACTIKVNAVEVPVSGVTLATEKLSLKKDESKSLTAAVIPEKATVQTLKWTSTHTDIATVSQTGVVTGVKPGETDIVVTTVDGGFTASCHVLVDQPAEGLSLDRATLELYEDDLPFLLTATVTPADASESVVWTSEDESIATVFGGSVRAQRAGTTVITATAGTMTAKCVVTVRCHVKGVSLKDHTLTVKKGDTEPLTATVYPERASNAKVRWSSSDETVASVSETGLLTAKASGTATITVTTDEGGFKDTCEVTVESNVTGIKLSASTLNLVVDETADLTATVEPAGASNAKVRWSSTDESVATVVEKEGKGHVVAVAPGKADICATTEDGGLHAFCSVQVGSKVDRITLSRNALSLYTTDAQDADASNRTLTATVTPADAEVELVWTSSDESVATVKATGTTCVVTPVGSGTATVRVSTPNGGVSASASVTVKQPYTAITLNRQTLSLDEGATATLTATASPQTADDAVVWNSSDPAVATVDANGRVSAVNGGTAVITAASRERPTVVRATCTVTVTSPVVHVTGVSLSSSSMDMYIGDSRIIVATITPANAENKNVSWRSSDESVATVNSSGTVLARSIGTTTITVTTEDGGKTATCNVTVRERPVGVTSLVLEQSAITLAFGNSEMLTAILLPENATNKNVIWSSSDETVAKVEGGRVTAQQKAGTVMITATSEDNPSLSATCTVKVVSQLVPVTDLTVTPSPLSIYLGQKKQLTATVSPSNATDQSVVWSVQQGGVASVDQNGVVTPLKVGLTRVVVRTNDGGYQKSVQVTVMKNDVSSIELRPNKVVLKVGETYDLTAQVKGIDTSAPASNPNVTWSSSSSTYASVAAVTGSSTDASVKTGRITARQAGSATITVTSSDNPSVKATCEVVVLDSGSSSGGNEGVEFDDWNF